MLFAKQISLQSPITPVLHRVFRLVTVFSGLYWLSSCAHRPEIERATVAGNGGFTTVIVDAGHGGRDSGATTGRSASLFLREKDLTLDTAKKVATHLKQSGLKVVMMRDDDRFIDLDERVAIANQYYPKAVLVSIHYNATGDHAETGAQTFFWHANSHGLATRIQSHLIGVTQERDHGVTRRRLRLTRNPIIPSVLCECAYLSNPSEAQLIAQSDYRSRIADSIASGIVEQSVKGDEGITQVAEIEAPMSRASDKYRTKRSKKRHHKKRRTS